MKKKRAPKLTLSRETLRELEPAQLKAIAAGLTPTGLCSYTLMLDCLTNSGPICS